MHSRLCWIEQPIIAQAWKDGKWPSEHFFINYSIDLLIKVSTVSGIWFLGKEICSGAIGRWLQCRYDLFFDPLLYFRNHALCVIENEIVKWKLQRDALLIALHVVTRFFFENSFKQ